MTNPFKITPTPPTSIKLEPGQDGKFSFTVESLEAPDKVHEVMVQALLVGEDGKGKDADWLLAGPRPTLSMTGGKTATVTITVKTATSPTGQHSIKLVVADKERPNDVFVDSPAVACEVMGPAVTKPPRPKLPWWLIAAIAGGVVAIGGVIALLVILSDGRGGLPPEQMASEISKVTCKQLVRCCTTDELRLETLGGDTEAKCVTVYTHFSTISSKLMEGSIAAGRIKYNGVALRACIDLVGDTTCSEFSRLHRNDTPRALYTPEPNGCEDPFDGQIANSAACWHDAECASNYCSGDRVDFNGNPTMGTCKAAPTLGKPCDGDDCFGHAWCNAGTCAAPKAAGMPCNSSDECANRSCDGGTCASSAICDGV